MAKEKFRYICRDCGYETVKWLGKCPGCGGWNTFSEEVIQVKDSSSARVNEHHQGANLLSEIAYDTTARILSGIEELDRVLGGGLVKGELVLLAGDPGIGKSTLTLQMIGKLAQERTVLYISGEESMEQIKMRAQRLRIKGENIYVLAQTNLEKIEDEIKRIKPQVIVLDSIQTVYLPEVSSAVGSVSQLRECTNRVMSWAKVWGIATMIVGHVTKEGAVAGPRVLEHMVDAVLFFEGDRHYQFRVLRAMKNRFGSVNEIGIFEMEEEGLVEVSNPSKAFLNQRPTNTAGTVVTACMEGIRPILVEVQGLVSPSFLNQPRRTMVGADFNRVALLLAVLEKRCGLKLGNQDVYVNVVGGLRLQEPATDLAYALALASSYRNKSIDSDCLILGEVGLTGEIRQVNHLQRRLDEAAKMGFRKALVPKGNQKVKTNIELIQVSDIKEALDVLLV